MMSYEELLYDEEEEFEKIVPKVKELVRIDKKTGKPKILHQSELSQAEVIACYLIGKFFSKKLNLSETETANASEISKELGLPQKVVNARLNDLRKAGIVERVKRGEYKISVIKLEDFVNKVLEKIKHTKGE